MAMQTHLAELEHRHQALEQEINEAMAHLSSDGLKIVELKRRKLLVKDEIVRLTAERQRSLNARSSRDSRRHSAAALRPSKLDLYAKNFQD